MNYRATNRMFSGKANQDQISRRDHRAIQSHCFVVAQYRYNQITRSAKHFSAELLQRMIVRDLQNVGGLFRECPNIDVAAAATIHEKGQPLTGPFSWRVICGNGRKLAARNSRAGTSVCKPSFYRQAAPTCARVETGQGPFGFGNKRANSAKLWPSQPLRSRYHSVTGNSPF